MKTFSLLSRAVALASAGAVAQFVKGNEAITVLPNGSKVLTPPLPHGALPVPEPCLERRLQCRRAGRWWKRQKA